MFCILSGLAAHAAGPEAAKTTMQQEADRASIAATLVADAAVITPGETFEVGVLFELAPGWHLYWQNPGDAGYATDITWRVGDASMSAVAWPAPQAFREADGVVTYGYAKEALLTATATVSDSIGQGLDIVAQVHYLACNVICSPHSVTLKKQLPVGSQAVAAGAAMQDLFKRYRALVPSMSVNPEITVESRLSQHAVKPGKPFSIALLLRGCPPNETNASCPPLTASQQIFVPYVSSNLTVRVMPTRVHPTDPGGLVVMMGGQLAETEINASVAQLRGVVQLQRDGRPLRPFNLEVNIPIAAASATIEPSTDPIFMQPQAMPSENPVGLGRSNEAPLRPWQALALALLGGLILNLMPCVLPVLAIKVIGITQAGQTARREIWQHGLAYTAGVVCSMLALGSVVLGLRAFGTAVGWGFQFQEPSFVAVVSCVLVLFALNCFGVFEIYPQASGLARAAAASQGWRRHVFDGVLAVVLATPCSAPFLSSAVAYAFTQGAVLSLAIFMVIGLGLAMPYVILTWIPGWLRFVPKPGPWMHHIKTLLGFGLLGTVIWLVWLIGRFAGVDAVAQLLLFLLGVACIAWVYGLVGHRYPNHQILLLTGLGLALTGAGYFSLSFKASPPSATVDENAYRPYSHSAVLAELTMGRPVFVDFSADWCITCKFNEAHVLHDAAVVEAFQKRRISAFRADWTRRDDTIRQTLARFGHSGVPMYLLYAPDNPSGPQVLPEILTVKQLLDALEAIPVH